MTHRYFTLLSRDPSDGLWAIEFGDYDRSVVEDELDDMADHPGNGIRRSNLKIITTSDDQASIYAAVGRLNER